MASVLCIALNVTLLAEYQDQRRLAYHEVTYRESSPSPSISGPSYKMASTLDFSLVAQL
jgi:hypothetical protein